MKRWRTTGSAILVLWLGAGTAQAQNLPLKEPAAPAAGECPRFPGPTLSPVEPAAAVDSLLTEGSRAAILGDHPAAEALLRRAAELDPTNPVVSYRLARTLDDQGRQRDAALEYCRYLTLAPNAADAEAVGARARGLLSSGTSRAHEPWWEATLEGVRAYAAGRQVEAVEAFTRALRHEPDLAESFYNRGLAHLAAGNDAEAAADLATYLRLSPDADDASPVRAELDRLFARAGPGARAAPTPTDPGAPDSAAASEPRADAGRTPPDPDAISVLPRRSAAPGLVLVQGLVVPGLGQLATGRTFWGLGVLAAVGGSVFLALHEETVVRSVEARDPFGNRYEYDVRARERPYRTIGIGAAVGIGLVAAIESYVYARGRPAPSGFAAAAARGAGSERMLTVAPTVEGIRLEVRVPLSRMPASPHAAR